MRAKKVENETAVANASTEDTKTEEVKAEEVKAAEKPAEEASVCEVVQKSVKDEKDKKLNKKELQAIDEERLASVKNEDLKVLATLLQEIRDENARERKYAKTQMRMAVFTSLTSLIIIILVAIGVAFIVPRILVVVNQADTIMQQTNDLVTQAETVMTNMEQVTNELAKADITGMLEDVDSLVVSSEESMSEALKKVTDIDIDSLNDAIKDLGSIVSPLAKLLGR